MNERIELEWYVATSDDSGEGRAAAGIGLRCKACGEMLSEWLISDAVSPTLPPLSALRREAYQVAEIHCEGEHPDMGDCEIELPDPPASVTNVFTFAGDDDE